MSLEGIHVAVITPDDRGRFRLGKWTAKDPEIQGWKVYVADDGRTIRLEAAS